MATHAKSEYYKPAFVGCDGEGGAHKCMELVTSRSEVTYTDGTSDIEVTEVTCGCPQFTAVGADYDCLTCKHEHADGARKCGKCPCKAPAWAGNLCRCGHARSSDPKRWPSGHSHEYMLLRVGDEYLYTGKPLTTWDCLEFLSGQQPNNAYPERIYVAYFFDYDATMMLRDIPEAKARRILYGRERYCLLAECWSKCRRYIAVDRKTDALGGCECGHSFDQHNRPRIGEHGNVFPVDIVSPFGQVYQVDYLPGKEFKVCKGRYQKGVKGKWVTISDLGTFFQQRFTTTLDEWDIGTDAQRELVAEGKKSRGTFTDMTDVEIEYNRIECVLLESLADEFRDACEQVSAILAGKGMPISVVPGQWQGPGRMAVAMLKSAGMPKSEDLNLPTEMLPTANAGYFGGRFEAPTIGYIPEVWEYDRNSAYPFAMTRLPCLIMGHGKWTKRNTRPAPADKSWWVGPVHFTGEAGRHIYGLPVRQPDGPHAGTVFFPREASGIYWSVEVEAAERIGTHIEIAGPVWHYQQSCNCQPFKWIEDIYPLRFTLKGGLKKVLKLGLNSLYGKQAQSIGEPPYANPVYAGLITADMRASLLDAMRLAKSDRSIAMFATDALFTTERLDLPGAHRAPANGVKALGEWDNARTCPDCAGAKSERQSCQGCQGSGEVYDSPYPSLFTIQPGLYLLSGELPKTRGIPRTRFTEYLDDFREAWQAVTDPGHSMPQIVIPLNVFRGAAYALHLRKWESAGQWFDDKAVYSFDWRTKRSDVCEMSSPWENLLTETVGLAAYPEPKPGGPEIESMPYRKAIGHWSDYEGRLMYESQPWGDGILESYV
jgi:hypothetical protein